MSLYREQFLKEHDFPEREPEKFLVIASTPRCGSHMLGHLLYQTDRFGFPLEYAQPANLAEWQRICGTPDTPTTIEAVMRTRTSSNGVFSIKLHYSHLEALGGFASVLQLFPHASCILLTRQNVLRQAVSLAIAAQTGVWIDGQGSPAKTPVYNREQIDRCLRRVLRENAAWRYLLAANGCNFLDLDFDTARANVAGTVERIASFANISLAGVEIPSAPVTRRQSSTINEGWARRFIAEHADGVLFPERSRDPSSHWQRPVRRLFERARRIASSS